MTDDELKNFIVINFGEYFKSTKEKLYSKLIEEQNLRKVAESPYLLLSKSCWITNEDDEDLMKMMESSSSDNCVHRYNIEMFELQLINTKPMIKNLLRELLSELRVSFKF